MCSLLSSTLFVTTKWYNKNWSKITNRFFYIQLKYDVSDSLKQTMHWKTKKHSPAAGLNKKTLE